jgi:hypothetical protein
MSKTPNREKLEAIRDSEDEPDIRRVMASSVLLSHDGKPSHTVAIAADLGWRLRRVETAAVAAEERGWLSALPKRRV